MLKFGIHKLDQLSLESTRGFWGERKFISIALYEELCDSDHPDREELQERVLLRFTTSTGTFKRTYQSRFEEFDNTALDAIRESVPANFCVHDVAVSDGRTSLDFIKSLLSLDGREFDFLATDYSPDVVLAEDDAGNLTLVLDGAGNLLQVIRPPFVFNIPKPEHPLIYPVNAFVLKYLINGRVRRLLERFQKNDAGVVVSKFQIICPTLRSLIKKNNNINFERYNIMDPMDRKFHVVRAMNILQTGYFTNAQLGVALRNIFASLEEGGLLITGRNNYADTQVQGSIFRKTNKRFELISKMNDGIPIHDFIESGEWSSA